MILTAIELEELTGKKNRDAQCRSLNFIGIEHKIRADGTVIVLRSHAEFEWVIYACAMAFFAAIMYAGTAIFINAWREYQERR